MTYTKKFSLVQYFDPRGARDINLTDVNNYLNDYTGKNKAEILRRMQVSDFHSLQGLLSDVDRRIAMMVETENFGEEYNKLVNFKFRVENDRALLEQVFANRRHDVINMARQGENTIRQELPPLAPAQTNAPLFNIASGAVEARANSTHFGVSTWVNPNSHLDSFQGASVFDNTVSTQPTRVVQPSTAPTRSTRGVQEKVNFSDKYVSLDMRNDFDGNNNLKTTTLIEILADLDRDGEVEINNNSWWNRTVRGQGEQRFSVPEATLKHVLQGRSQQELEALYTRITDRPGTDIRFDKNDFRGYDNQDRENYSVRNLVLTPTHKNTLQAFRDALTNRASSMADIMQVIASSSASPQLKNQYGNVRAGLASVVNGTEDQFLANLVAASNNGEMERILATSQALKEEGMMTKFINGLTTFGLSGSIPVSAGAYVNLGLQNERLNPDNLWRGQNIDWKTGEWYFRTGPNSRVGIDANLASLDAFWNWNDPKMTIDTSVGYIRQAANKKETSEMIIAEAVNMVKNTRGISERDIQPYVDGYRQSVDKLLAIRNEKTATEVDNMLARNTSLFVGKVLQKKGWNLQGLFGGISPLGLHFGLSIASTNVSATREGINSHSATLEAMLNYQEVSEEKIHQTLAKYGITPDGRGGYLKNGQPYIPSPGLDKKIVWRVYDIADTAEAKLEGEIDIVDVKTRTILETRKISLDGLWVRIQNPEYRNASVEQHSKLLAQWLLEIRRVNRREQVAKLVNFQNLATAERYDEAITVLKTLFNPRGKYHRPTQEAIALAGNDPVARKALVDLMLGKTSGWHESRTTAAALMEARDTQTFEKRMASLRNYYHGRVGSAFDNSYGFSRWTAKSLFDKMVAGMTEARTSTLGQQAPSGFHALVAYSQTSGFKALDPVRHSNARIYGNTVEVTGEVARNVRNRMRANLDPTLVANVVSALEKGQFFPNASRQELENRAKDLLTSGKVRSYLSFEPNAECFNLGFIVEPGALEVQNSTHLGDRVGHGLGEGAIVLNEVVGKNQLRIGIGLGWNGNGGGQNSSSTTQTGERTPSNSIGTQPTTTTVQGNASSSTLNSTTGATSMNPSNTVTRIR